MKKGISGHYAKRVKRYTKEKREIMGQLLASEMGKPAISKGLNISLQAVEDMITLH